VRAPLVEAEQDSSICIQDLPKVIVGRECSRLAEQRLVPSQAARHVAHTYDCPRALHRVQLQPDSGLDDLPVTGGLKRNPQLLVAMSPQCLMPTIGSRLACHRLRQILSHWQIIGNRTELLARLFVAGSREVTDSPWWPRRSS
jgi:hypothetical protein